MDTPISIDEFEDALKDNDTTIFDFVTDGLDEVVELFETGSVEVTIGSKKYMLALVITEES